MRHIDYGLGVLTRARAGAPSRPIARSTSRRSTSTCSPQAIWRPSKSRERFYEIGSPEGLEETRAFLAAKAANRR